MSKAKRTFIPYKSYMFRDKDPIIDSVRTALADSGLSYAEVGAAVGRKNFSSTLRNWFVGSVRRPQFATVEATLRACGKTLQVQDVQRKRPALKVVGK